MVVSYSVTPLDPDSDRRQLVSLWQRNWLAPPPETRWDWLYRMGSGRGFLLHEAAEGCVGACGLMPRTMRISGVDRPAGVAADLSVDQAHRSVGPALKLERALARAADESGLRLVYAFPNRRSEPIFERIGYRKLGPFERWSLPLRSERYVHSMLPAPWLARAAAFVVDAGLRVRMRRRCGFLPADARFIEVTTYDERFDELWQRIAARHPVLGQRDAAYLNWRFGSDPEGGFRTLAACGPQGEINAYLTWRRHGDAVSIVDCLYDTPAQWRGTVAAFLQQMRREHAARISFWFLGPREPLEILRPFGFWLRDASRAAFVRVAPGPSPVPVSLDRNDWWLTVADADASQ